MQQGLTEAILCRAEDDCLYVVKSRSAGCDALVKEWIAGRIGQELGLPIPEMETVYIERGKAQYMAHPEAKVLARCPGFASRFVPDPTELSPAIAPEVSADLRAKVLLFDWWVLNGDRIDGNPNLIWVAHRHSLHVIDHNLAFGSPDEPADFWQHHIFRNDRALWDAGFRAVAMPKMHRILQELPVMWGELPEPWTESCTVELQTVDILLRRVDTDPTFWGLP